MRPGLCFVLNGRRCLARHRALAGLLVSAALAASGLPAAAQIHVPTYSLLARAPLSISTNHAYATWMAFEVEPNTYVPVLEITAPQHATFLEIHLSASAAQIGVIDDGHLEEHSTHLYNKNTMSWDSSGYLSEFAYGGWPGRVYTPDSVNGDGRLRIWVRSNSPQRQLLVRLEVFSSRPVTFREFFE